MLENQLSRYGAIAKALPLMNPGAKVVFLAPSSASWYGDFQHEFPAGKDGLERVFSSIANVQSYAGLSANRGDVVIALPGYTETLTAVKSLTTAGVKWIGVGEGTLKPTITVNAASHGIALAANNVEFNGFRFAAPETDGALSMIHIDDNCVGCIIRNVEGIGSNEANNFLNCIDIGTGANDHLIENVRLTAGGVAVTSFIQFNGPVSRSTIGGFFACGSVATGGIIDATGAYIENADWKNVDVCVGGSAKPAVNLDATGGGGGKGFIRDSKFAGTVTTLANNAVFTGDYRLHEVTVSEATNNSSQGAIIPAADTD